MRFSWLRSCLGLRKLSRSQRRYLKRTRLYMPPRLERLEDRLAPATLSGTPGGTVTLGSGANLTDSATLSGGNSPTGTITFTLIAPSGGTVDTETVTVNGNGTYNTPNGYLPTAAGAYQWNSSYSGDPNNTSASDNNDPAEQVSVSQVQPSLTATPNPTSVLLPTNLTLGDSVAVSNGYNETGNLTFTLVAPDGTVAETDIVPVNGNNTYIASGGSANNANLVQNGGFETGNLTGWTFTPSSTGSDFEVDGIIPPHTGQYAADFGAVTFVPDSISQTLTTVPGQTYTLSYWLSHNTSDSENDFQVSWGGNVVQNLSNTNAFGWTNYTFTETASSSTTVLQFSGYELPAWYALDDVSVTARGYTPTQLGTYQWNVSYSGDSNNKSVSDNNDPAEQVNAQPSPPNFTADTPPSAVVGNLYSYQFQANGWQPITFSATNLPAWAQLDPTTGILSGTPTTAGTFNFTVTASNGTLPNAIANVSLTAQYEPPAFTADTPPSATGGTPYSYQFQAVNAGPQPMRYTASGLPGWAALNPSTGVLSGTPNVDGTFNFTVTASNGVAPDTTANVNLVVFGGSALTFDVAAGTSFTVPNGTYAGGTTFNVGANANVTINSGTFSGGAVFNVAAGGVVNITSSPSFSGLLVGSGSGTVQVGNGRLYIGSGGATLDFTGNMFQWVGGQMDLGNGNLTNLGTMTITAPVDFYNDGILYNYGTIIQTGSGNLQLGTDGTFPSTLVNEAGASYLLEGNGGLTEISDSGSAPGQTSLDNAGIIRKTAGTGASPLNVLGSITNTGTIEADSGSIALNAALGISQISGNSLTAGTWKAVNGAALDLPSGTNITTNQANLTLSGSGATISGIAALNSNSGSLTLTNGANFATTASFANSGSLTLGAGSTLTVNGTFTQTSQGALIEQIGGTPASNQFGQAAITGTASLAGNFALNVVNGFTPAAGQSYQVLSFAGETGNFAQFYGFGSTFSDVLNANSLDIGSYLSPVDLDVASVTAPATVSSGQSITVSWQTDNQTNQSTTASWQDSVYLSSTPTITANSILLGTVVHSGGIAANGSYNASLTANLPGSAPGNDYVLVQTDSLYQVPDPSRTNNIGVAANQVAITVPTPVLGTPYQDSFTAASESKYYEINVPAGGTLVVSLASAATSGATALYISQGTPPTPYNYQERSANNQPNQTVTVPQVFSAGTYYILVQGVSGAAATSGFTLTVTQSSAMTITSFSPASAGNGGNATVQINGTNFAADATASLTSGNTTITATSVNYISASEIQAIFNLSGAAVGNYSVNVTSGGQTATAATSFQVLSAVTNPVQLVLTPPSLIRAGRDSVVTVTVTNTSNNDILAPLLQLTANGATLRLPSQQAFQGSSLYFLATSPTGQAGVLTAGESVQVQIDFQSTTTNPEINFQLNQADDSQSMNWASQESALQIPTIPNAAWPIVFSNFEAAMGNTVASYHAVVAADATYLAQIGEPTNDVEQLVEFELEKANAAYTAQTLVSVTAANLPAPGMPLTFTQSYLDSISGRYYQGLLGAQAWSTNWDITAATVASGNVSIQMSGSYIFFFRQSDGSYLPEAGGQGEVLTVSNGAYRLLEPNGTVYQFNTNGSLAYLQDANGNRITASYNASGQLVQLTDSNGEYLQLSYNSQGQMVALTDSSGQTETYSYTGQFLTSFTDASATTNYSYVSGGTAAQNGSLSGIAYADNTHVYYAYDAQGRLIDQHLDGGAEDQQYSYLNPGGFVTTDGDGNRTTIYFNLYGATAETIDGLGNVTLYKYDANLNLAQVVAPGGAVTSYSYDSNGNLASETNPLGNTTRFTYSSNNNLTSYTDAKGNTTSYAYDSSNDLLSVTYADGTSKQYTYNPLGEATGFLNANGNSISSTYNANGQVSQENFANGTTYSYSYNAQGNMTSATDAQGHITNFFYQNASNPNLLTEVDFPDGTWLRFSYNAVGQRTQSVDQTGFTVNYTYDTTGRLAKLTDANGNLIVQYLYDNAGNLIQKNNGNGTFTVYTYDADSRVLSITNYAPSTGGTNFVPANSAINSFDAYTYDAHGNILTDTNQDGQWVYTYDAASELTGAVFTPNSTNPDGLTAQNLLYAYDAAGNRVSETINGVVTTYVANNMNEYTSSTTAGVGTTSYHYDANGNLISTTDASSNTTTYSYDQLNELTGVNGPGLTASYAYNPLSQMVSQTVNGATTNYQVDPNGSGNVVATLSGSAVYNNSGGLTAHYTYGLGLTSQVSASAAPAYYDFNNVGDTVGITNATGSYVNRYAYLPYGQTTTITAALGNVFTFQGELGDLANVDGTSSVRFRVYNSAIGQFNSSDPTGLAGGSTNLREFARDNPVALVDPSGLCFMTVGVSGGFWGGASGSFIVDENGELYFSLSGGFTTPGIGGGVTWSPGEVSTGWGGQVSVGIPVYGPAGVTGSWDVGADGSMTWEGGAGVGFLSKYDLGVSVMGGYTWDLHTKAPFGISAPCPCHCPPNNPPNSPTNPGPNNNTNNENPEDPNAIIGPAGYGTQGFIHDNGTWSYTIDFENDGTTAAQDVTVTQQLDPNLNWSTFQLNSFGFGPVNVAVPAGLTQYQTTVSYHNTDGTALNVLVNLYFNVATGLLTVSYTSLDPTTGLAPAGVFDGFLPPNDSTGVGEGYVQYTVQPAANLTTGTTITQQASVVFDINGAIVTNPPAVNTIDTGAELTSSVIALPAQSTPTFTVNWSGSDTGGSGIAFYNVYVSDNGGPFTLWQNQTTQTSATYNGVYGHTYGFYSVATDNLGDVQPTPTAAQAMTTVPALSVASTPTINALAGISTGPVLLATFTQGVATQSASAYTAAVAWGDGYSDTSTEANSPITIQFSGQTISVYGAHTYTAAVTENLTVTLSTTGSSATAYPTAPVAPNVSSQVRSSASGLVYNRATQLFGGTITLTNTGTTALSGQLVIVFTRLQQYGVTLSNASGTDANGDPYIVVNLTAPLLPGHSITFNVFFRNPNRVLFSYGLTTFDNPPPPNT